MSPCPKERWIYLIGGCNGAGKTTFAREFLPSVGAPRFLNADEIARGLSPLAVEAVALKAGRILLQEFRSLVEKGESFGLESTLSGKTYVGLLKWAQTQGYRVEVNYVWIPNFRVALRRVRQRVSKGGHNVPPADVRRRYERSIELFLHEYAELADTWALWDNSNPPAKRLADSVTHTKLQLKDLFYVEAPHRP